MPQVVRVSQKGQATIPKALRERFDIDTPGEVFIYEADDRIIIEPVPSADELHGMHDGSHDDGEVLERMRQRKAEAAHDEFERIAPTEEP